jgi:hypothetical protein
VIDRNSLTNRRVENDVVQMIAEIVGRCVVRMKVVHVVLSALSTLAIISGFERASAAGSVCDDKKSKPACEKVGSWRQGGLSHRCEWSKEDGKCRHATDNIATPGGSPRENEVYKPGPLHEARR